MSPLWERLRGFEADIDVVDGHDPEALRKALGTSAQRPRLIVMRTIKGRGVSFMENRMEWHYLPLDAQQYETALLEIESQ